jgi:hypothetical protein
MIDVKTAVKNAILFLADLLAEQNVHDVRLEEVELSEDEKVWFITLSYLRRSAEGEGTVIGKMLAAGELMGARVEREYKVFAVDSVTGEVRSMKMRQLV